MYRIMASKIDADDDDVRIRAAYVYTVVEAEAFSMAVLADLVSSPITSLRKLEDGLYGAFYGEKLVGFCKIEKMKNLKDCKKRKKL